MLGTRKQKEVINRKNFIEYELKALLIRLYPFIVNVKYEHNSELQGMEFCIITAKNWEKCAETTYKFVIDTLSMPEIAFFTLQKIEEINNAFLECHSY